MSRDAESMTTLHIRPQHRWRRCYELAWRELMENPEAVLVHGWWLATVDRELSALIEHAWLEVEGLIWEPVGMISYEPGCFPGRAVHRYTLKEAADLVWKDGTFGPWGPIPPWRPM